MGTPGHLHRFHSVLRVPGGFLGFLCTFDCISQLVSIISDMYLYFIACSIV